MKKLIVAPFALVVAAVAPGPQQKAQKREKKQIHKDAATPAEPAKQ